MTRNERAVTLELLHAVRLDGLPDAALRFLREYLVAANSFDKVAALLEEARRLNEAGKYAETGYYEHAAFPATEERP